MVNARINVFGDVACRTTNFPGGVLEIACAQPLQSHPNTLVDSLAKHALTHPERNLFIQIGEDGQRRTLSYGQAASLSLTIARGITAIAGAERRPIALLADNSIECALIILGAYRAGVPVAPISPAYSTMSSDHKKLQHIVHLLAPSLVVFDDGEAHKGAHAAIAECGAPFLAITRECQGMGGWNSLLKTGASGDGPLAAAQTDAPAKILFTSGSTGMPKGVINTHRMMTSNQQALGQIWPVITAEPLTLVDWLPWNHTFGGNQNFNMALFHGGTLVIDQGRPTASGIDKTAATLKSFSPSVYFNVPRGFDMLVSAMKKDEELKRALFSSVELLGYAGAALPRPVWEALKAMSREIKGREIPVVGLWGSTETGPVVTAVYFPSDHPGNIGLPIPGAKLRLIPEKSGKLEMRVKSPSVTAGYWGQPDLSAALFDEDGFLKMGDAGKLADESDVASGILFDGRLSENFKLLSGTWVNVGQLRVALIGACPELISDVVIAGHDADYLSALIFPKLGGCRALTVGATLTDAEVLQHPRVRQAVIDALSIHNTTVRGSSQKIRHATLLEKPPSVDAGEITDKGYLNQREVLARRLDLVSDLYAATPAQHVLRLSAAE